MPYPLSLRLHGLAFLETQTVALAGVDDHGVAFAKHAFEHLHRQRVEHTPLNGPLERPGAVGGIVTLADQRLFGGVGELDEDLPLLEPAREAAELDVDDFLHVLAAQRVEEDDLVD